MMFVLVHYCTVQISNKKSQLHHHITHIAHCSVRIDDSIFVQFTSALAPPHVAVFEDAMHAPREDTRSAAID